jgi:hypothetical protein
MLASTTTILNYGAQHRLALVLVLMAVTIAALLTSTATMLIYGAQPGLALVSVLLTLTLLQC